MERKRLTATTTPRPELTYAGNRARLMRRLHALTGHRPPPGPTGNVGQAGTEQQGGAS